MPKASDFEWLVLEYDRKISQTQAPQKETSWVCLSHTPV